ncbi:uncharacterized protein METZ01_LOCUS510278, partial [marine metagenome]
MNLTPNSKSSISLVKFLTPNSKTYKIKNPMFKHIDIVGEVHGGKKDEPTGLSEYIEKNGYEIIILEVPKSYMTKTMNELKKGYNQQIIKNATAKPRDDSYIDNVMNYFINTHYSFKIKYKKLINVKNIKLQCLDDRPLKDYPDKSISVMYKTKQEQLIIELLKKITEIKKKVIKMDASKINNNLLTIINFNFKNLL